MKQWKYIILTGIYLFILTGCTFYETGTAPAFTASIVPSGQVSASPVATGSKTRPVIPTSSPTPAIPSATPVPADIELKELTSPIGRNQTATITVKSKPNTIHEIKVLYATGESKAKGLVAKTSNAAGIVSWSWKIGGEYKKGNCIYFNFWCRRNSGCRFYYQIEGTRSASNYSFTLLTATKL